MLLRTGFRSTEYRQEKDREFLHSLSSFLCKHCICRHKYDYRIVDMPHIVRLDIFALRQTRYVFASRKRDMI